MSAKKKKISELRTNSPQFITGLAISSMIFGIIAILFFWVVFIGLILGILAFALGIATLRTGKHKSISFAGVVTGLVAVIMNLAMIFFFISGLITYSVVTAPNTQVVAEQN